MPTARAISRSDTASMPPCSKAARAAARIWSLVSTYTVYTFWRALQSPGPQAMNERSFSPRPDVRCRPEARRQARQAARRGAGAVRDARLRRRRGARDRQGRRRRHRHALSLLQGQGRAGERALPALEGRLQRDGARAAARRFGAPRDLLAHLAAHDAVRADMSARTAS